MLVKLEPRGEISRTAAYLTPFLAVALTLVPALSAKVIVSQRGLVRRAVDRLMGALQDGYAASVRRLLEVAWLPPLLFVALLERRVVLLPGEGLEKALDSSGWEEVVRLATEGFRSGHPARGLEAAVRRCGEIVARLPGSPRDLAELPAPLVLEEGCEAL